MTIRKFFKLYNHYQDNFDYELILNKNGITYAKAKEMAIKDEEWL